MSEWKKVRLGDVIEINKNSIDRNYQYETIHYYDISSIGTGSIEDSSELLLLDAPSRAKRIVNDGDTVIATVRPGNKSYYHFTSTRINDIVSTGFAVLNAKADINHKFLYYLVTNDSFTKYLVSNERGATYPAVSASDFNRAMIQLPPLPTQKKIAKILSNYDDLIENNLKRIKLLEESARLTYEEWFLRFKVDGEKLKIDSETGLPFGWEEIRLKDLITFYNGKACTIGQSDGKYSVYGSNGKVGKLDQFKYENVIIIGRVGAYCGTVFYVKEKCWATDNTIIVKPNKNDIFFLYYSLDTYNLNNYAGGSAQPLLTQGWLKPLKIKYPKEELITKFDKIVEPMFKEMKTLDNQNQLLKEARDILLPRLMTGMIDVEEMEVAV